MMLQDIVEKKIEQIFIDISKQIHEDDTITEDEAAAIPLMLFRASNYLVNSWKQFLDELPKCIQLP